MAPDELQHGQESPTQSAVNPAAAAGPSATASPSTLDPSLSRNPDPQVPGKEAPAAPRPPGEIGGHTVQPWEQDPAAGMERKPTSKDVPPPQAGAAEAKVAGPGPGQVTTAAPGNAPSRQGQPGGTATAAQAGAADAGAAAKEEAATPERSASLDDKRNGAASASASAPAATRPPRPPVYSPQQGHEPAPRPPPSHAPGGPGTDGDRLVEAISRAIAENLGKAFHQSVAQAVREVFPLSARTVDSGMPTSNGAGAGAGPGPSPARPSFTQASTAAGTAGGKVPPQAPQPGKGQVTPGPAASNRPGGAGGKVARAEGTPQAGARRSDAGTGQHGPPPGASRDTAAPESPGPSGSHPTGKEPMFAVGTTKAVDPTKGEPKAQPQRGEAVAPDGRTGPATSMFGGTIEPPVPAPADKSPPGNAAAASADEETRKGALA